MKKNNKKIKNVIRMIIAILLIILLVIYALYQIIHLITKPTNIVTVENGKIFSEISKEGYIIREEKVLKGENYKNGMSQIKAEREKIAIGENAFRYYTKDEETLTSKIQELDNKIAETQTDENRVLSSDLKVIEDEIQAKIDQMYKMNDVKKVQEYRSNIEDLIKKKTKIIGTLSPAGSKMQELIQKRSEYENKLNTGSEYMKAELSGMVSYKVDGLEEILTPDSIDSLSVKFLNDLNCKTGQIIQTSTDSGKIVNNYNCFIASVLDDKESAKIEENKNIKLRLSNGDEIPTKIEKIIEDNNKKIIVFKIKKDVEELLEYRKINFDIILWSYSGLKVPNSTIIEEDGLNYVYRNRAGYKDKILVKVEKQNENYSIIDDYTTEELRKMGWTTREIVNKKSVGIYDEIIVDPKND